MARSTKPGGAKVVKPKKITFLSKWGKPPRIPGPPKQKPVFWKPTVSPGKRGR